jgi:hypothetical protein
LRISAFSASLRLSRFFLHPAAEIVSAADGVLAPAAHFDLENNLLAFNRNRPRAAMTRLPFSAVRQKKLFESRAKPITYQAANKNNF